MLARNIYYPLISLICNFLRWIRNWLYKTMWMIILVLESWSSDGWLRRARLVFGVKICHRVDWIITLDRHSNHGLSTFIGVDLSGQKSLLDYGHCMGKQNATKSMIAGRYNSRTQKSKNMHWAAIWWIQWLAMLAGKSNKNCLVQMGKKHQTTWQSSQKVCHLEQTHLDSTSI